MFERNRSSNSIERNRTPVIVTLLGGEELSGYVRIAAGARLADLLNGASGFIEFEPRDGGDVLLNRNAIASIAMLAVPRSDQLSRVEQGSFDPYAVLGVERGASTEALKEAYRSLARIYHPDRFASADLPSEMQAYANAMLARINVAYRSLAGATVRVA